MNGFACEGFCVLQVLASIQRNKEMEAIVFAVKEQYVAQIRKTRQARPSDAEQVGEDGNKEVEPPAPEPKKWRYAEIRKDFLNQMKAEGYNYEQASQLWDDAGVKRNYLKDVSIPELKRRKFIPKGSTMNPWADDE